MSQDLEITPQGIKLSYLRFLSDSAAGYVLLMLVGMVYRLGLPFPFLGSISSVQLTNEGRIFFFVLLFLLATPLGLALNALSWFLLGTINVWLLRLWLFLPRAASFLVISTRRSLHSENVVRFFGLKEDKGRSNRLYEQASYYESLLSLYSPLLYDQLEHKRGLRRFIRSLALLALFATLYCFLTLHDRRLGILSGSIFGFLVVFVSLLEYDQCIDVLFRVYILSSERDGETPSREQIVSRLSKSWERFQKGR